MPSNRLEIIGPSDLIKEMQASLEQDGNWKLETSTIREPGIGGTDILTLVLDITEVSVKLVSIYLASHHLMREAVKLRKDKKKIDLQGASEQEKIEEKIGN